MVTRESIEEQLKDINYNYHGWGRTEVRELPDVIMPDEKIFECVNGIYEGGFALLVATNFRVLLIDKKPLNYLTVEDLRFDMISEIDYSHRLLGARISISTGSKNLRFLSYNQPRLRKLVTHVQNTMAEIKKKQSEHEEGQKTHLEQINQQLQAYLLAQHQQQQKIQQHLEKNAQPADMQPVKPAPELADYLYAQSLLAQHGADKTGEPAGEDVGAPAKAPTVAAPESADTATGGLLAVSDARAADLYEEGMNEIFGRRGGTSSGAGGGGGAPTSASPPATTAHQPLAARPQAPAASASPLHLTSHAVQHARDANPLRIAYSKLPLAMRNKKFGRPSFHAHSQADNTEEELSPTSSEVATAHY